MYPTALRYMAEPRSVEALRFRMRDALAIATVELRTEEPRYPWRAPDGRLLFPVGHFTTTLATPELRVAMERGEIVSVGTTCIYAQAPIFDEWVGQLHPLRVQLQERGALFQARILKDLLNTLHGKFGERSVRWETVADEPELPDDLFQVRDVDAQEDQTYRRVGGVLQLRQQETDGFNSFPAISAHVVSAARLLLWSYAERAGRDHVAYLDTDGLVVDDVGYARLAECIHPTELGKLKLVRESDDITIRGPKDIRFGATRIAKGRKAKAKTLPDGRFEQDEFWGIGAALRAGVSGGPMIQRVQKREAAPKLPSGVQPDGHVPPLRVGGGRVDALPHVEAHDPNRQRP